MLPSATGGANWQGGAFDPETKMFYVYSTTTPTALGLVKPDPARSDFGYVAGHRARSERAGRPARGRGRAGGAAAPAAGGRRAAARRWRGRRAGPPGGRGGGRGGGGGGGGGADRAGPAADQAAVRAHHRDRHEQGRHRAGRSRTATRRTTSRIIRR